MNLLCLLLLQPYGAQQYPVGHPQYVEQYPMVQQYPVGQQYPQPYPVGHLQYAQQYPVGHPQYVQQYPVGHPLYVARYPMGHPLYVEQPVVVEESIQPGFGGCQEVIEEIIEQPVYPQETVIVEEVRRPVSVVNLAQLEYSCLYNLV